MKNPFKGNRMTTDFSYSHSLQESNPFNSDWVSNVWYAERAQEMLLRTLEGRDYLYNRVPRTEYNLLVDTVKAGASVGGAVNSIKHVYGPAVHTGPFRPVPLAPPVTVDVAPGDVVSVPKDVNSPVEPLPEAYSTVIHYVLNGQPQTMTTRATGEQALRDYVNGVKLLGANAHLVKMEIIFEKPELDFS